MGATAAVHPADPIMQAYGLGKLDDVSSESVSKHLESCPECQRRVAEMSSDSFLGRLRGAQAQPGSPVPAPVVSSIDGMSMVDASVSKTSRPPSNILPPGVAEHSDYEVIRELGQGGMGTVYLAHNRLMGRHEVLKVVSSHLVKRSGVLDRFLGEIRNAARLHHTNVVTAYSAIRLGGSMVFAMEYVDGLDLTKLVKAKGALPVSNACNYIHQAALGLQHANEFGMVHRDIKPSNLMLAKQGNRAVIKVLDFGLAKVKSEGAVDGGLTHEGQMLGTPDFIAPEQIGDARRADIRADIYSLGCTLYYLLTGGPPFKATSLYEILQAHHSMDALPLNLARPEVPVELAALVARMMAKEPERRFQTPTEVAQALAPFFKKGSLSARMSNPEVSQTGPTESKLRETSNKAMSRRPDDNSAASPSTSKKKPTGTQRQESIWDSLIELEKGEPPTESTPALAVPLRPAARWIWPAAAAVVLAFALLAAVVLGVFMLKTASGTIVIDNLPENAIVEVDGDRITIRPSTGEPLLIERAAGKHAVVVKWRDALLLGESVTVESGKQFKLTVRLDPPNANGTSSPVDATIETNVADRVAPGNPSRVPQPAEISTKHVEASSLDKLIPAKLDMLIPMKYPEGTPLENVLSDIKRATKGPNDPGIPIYVNPIGLQEAEKSLASTITIDVEALPLKTTLPLILKQLDLTYYISDGLLVITSNESIIEEEIRAIPVIAFDKSSRTKAIVAALDKPVAMPFAQETPLEDVLNHIKTATKRPADSGIAIYVNPIGLQEAEKSMTSTIKIDVEGVPLRTTLRLLLRQLDLGYYVKDGMLNISSLEDRNLDGDIFVLDKAKGDEPPPRSRAILAKLRASVPMPFAKKTMLKDVLTYITNATKRDDDSGIPIDVDPKGLRQAGRSLTSTVTLDLDSVPLGVSLRMLLEQLGLGYYLNDGRLIINNPDAIETERKKAGKD